MKRIVSILLIVLTLVALTACGGSERSEETNDFVFRNKDSVELGNPDKTLDPQAIYSSLTYTPQMFYGHYRLEGGDAAEDKFASEATYAPLTIKGETKDYSVLPMEFRAGKNTMAHAVNYIKDYNWMEVHFKFKSENDNKYYLDIINCAYKIEGNKLILTPLENFNVDDENNKITYELSDTRLEYTFSFSGRHLTLSSGSDSVTMTTCLDAYGEKAYASVGNYLSPDSKNIDGIDYISFLDDKDDSSSFQISMINGEHSSGSVGVLYDNGLFTFTLKLKDSVKTYQFVYFYCGRDGIILTDGVNTYYYNDSSSDRNKHILSDYLTEEQLSKLEDFTETQLEALVAKKDQLVSELTKALNDAGIDININKQTGEFAIDSAVLFDGDSAVLKDKGKEFLDKFVKIYGAVIYNSSYNGFISKTMVEGHTAPIAGSTYESGLPLSQQRAQNVVDYCISIDTDGSGKLADSLMAVGYSNSKPVLDEDGNVNMAASRRVAFRFIIDLEKLAGIV